MSTRDKADSIDEPRKERRKSDEWRTALTCIEPNKILVRGYPLDEVMGRLTFGEAIYLLLMGEIPSPGIGRLMEAMLVSFIDHGATPPSTLAARNTATTGAALRACVAAGVLGFGSYHGGDIESCMQFLDNGLEMVRKGASYREAAARLRRTVARTSDEPPPGFGHRFHTRDPRAAPSVPDGARARGRGRAHPDDSRRRDDAARADRSRDAGRCRSTSTARSRRSAAISAFRRASPTRCSSSRASPASPRTPRKSAFASSRCARSTRRITLTTGHRSAGCPNGENSRRPAGVADRAGFG